MHECVITTVFVKKENANVSALSSYTVKSIESTPVMSQAFSYQNGAEIHRAHWLFVSLDCNHLLIDYNHLLFSVQDVW